MHRDVTVRQAEVAIWVREMSGQGRHNLSASLLLGLILDSDVLS